MNNIKSLVSETCTVNGLGIVTLTGPVPGALTFTSQYTTALNDIPVKIVQLDTNRVIIAWEYRTATLVGNTLTRDSVIRSSNNNTPVTFTGACECFVFQPAELQTQLEAAVIGLDARVDVLELGGGGGGGGGGGVAASDTVAGITRYATDAETFDAPDVEAAVKPSRLRAFLNAVRTSSKLRIGPAVQHVYSWFTNPTTPRNPTTVPPGSRMYGARLESPNPAIIGDFENWVELSGDVVANDNITWHWGTPFKAGTNCGYYETIETHFGSTGVGSTLRQMERYDSFAAYGGDWQRLGITGEVKFSSNGISGTLFRCVSDAFLGTIPPTRTAAPGQPAIVQHKGPIGETYYRINADGTMRLTHFRDALDAARRTYFDVTYVTNSETEFFVQLTARAEGTGSSNLVSNTTLQLNSARVELPNCTFANIGNAQNTPVVVTPWKGVAVRDTVSAATAASYGQSHITRFSDAGYVNEWRVSGILNNGQAYRSLWPRAWRVTLGAPTGTLNGNQHVYNVTHSLQTPGVILYLIDNTLPNTLPVCLNSTSVPGLVVVIQDANNLQMQFTAASVPASGRYTLMMMTV